MQGYRTISGYIESANDIVMLISKFSFVLILAIESTGVHVTISFQKKTEGYTQGLRQ